MACNSKLLFRICSLFSGLNSAPRCAASKVFNVHASSALGGGDYQICLGEGHYPAASYADMLNIPRRFLAEATYVGETSATSCNTLVYSGN